MNQKCQICGFETKIALKNEDGYVCERDLKNPYLFIKARKLSNFAKGLIKLDTYHNRSAKDKNQVQQIVLKKRTKNFLAIDEAVFSGTQKTL